MQRVIRAETLQTRANRSAGAIGQRAEKDKMAGEAEELRRKSRCGS